MKKLILISLIIMSQIANAGSEGVGGGDPDAVDYLLTTKTLSQWIVKSNFGLNTEEKQKIEQTYKRLSAEMNNQTLTPIRFSNQTLADKSGTEKIAIYSKDPFSITVNRSQWKNLNQQDKFIVAGLEILGLADIKDRYDLAGQIQKSVDSLSDLQGDIQLLNFLTGSWTVADGACLSGSAVNWGNDSNNNFIENYEFNFQFNADLSFKNELLFKGSLLASGKGNFVVKNANLTMTTKESCRYDSGNKPCENVLDSESSGLLTIQKNQIWILYNQGHLGGSCGPQDVFIMKFNRQ